VINIFILSDMKKFFHFKGILIKVVILAILANVSIASAQTGKRLQYSIPPDINKIFQTSCLPCHGDSGGRFPTSKLKFSRWAGYSATEQVGKAAHICSEVRKGKMPPKSVRESNPELIPSKEQVDLICKWSESLKSEKEKK
jgi:cytochrome c553